jgi:hypothetical protein
VTTFFKKENSDCPIYYEYTLPAEFSSGPGTDCTIQPDKEISAFTCTFEDTTSLAGIFTGSVTGYSLGSTDTSTTIPMTFYVIQ